MRIRTIKPEFWTSDDIAELDVATRLLYIGLWNYVDDYGVGRDNERLIQAALFPLDPFTEASLRTHGGLTELSSRGLITRFEGPDGRRYLQINSWAAHQTINRPSKQIYPRYDAETCTLTEPSVSPHGALTEGSRLEQGTGNREEEQGTGSREGVQGEVAQHELEPEPAPTASRKRAAQKTATGSKTASGSRIPDGWQPSPDLAAWTRTHAPAAANDREVDRFRDYWTAQPGARGRKSDWDATWRNWARKTQDDAQARGAPGTPPLDITQPTTDAEAAALVASIYTPTALKRILAEEEEPR